MGYFLMGLFTVVVTSIALVDFGARVRRDDIDERSGPHP